MTEGSAKFRHDSKQLAIMIYDFLLDESSNKLMSKRNRSYVEKAADAMEKIYKITMRDYIFGRATQDLLGIFIMGNRSVPVWKRIQAETHKRKGNEFMEAELYRKAEEEYTKAMRLDPRNAIYYCNRAASRIRQGLFTDAVADCDKALQLDRHYTKAYSWMGIAHAMMNHPGQAVRCYRKALRIEPENKVCVENMDLINRKMNHAAFRILVEPFYFCRRGLARIASSLVKNNQNCFRLRNEKNTSENNNISDKLEVQKFCLGDLD